MEEKILILQSNQEFEVNILKLKLENSGIPCWVMNKHDSSYNNFGDLELYVSESHVIEAKKIISQAE